MYNIAVTKTFIAKLKLMRVMERLADDEGSHLIDDFERSLSVKDDDGNDGTVATLHRDSETIVEPVKGVSFYVNEFISFKLLIRHAFCRAVPRDFSRGCRTYILSTTWLWFS